MRVALVVTNLGIGGAERQVVDLADRLNSRGHDVLIISLGKDRQLLPASSTVKVVSLNLAMGFLSLACAYRQASVLLRDFEPDVVHSHMVHANLFARLLRFAIAFPRLVCSAHNSYEQARWRLWAYRVTDPLADLTTNVSDQAVEAYIQVRAISRKRALTVYNGIDCERFQFRSEARGKLRLQHGLPQGVKVVLAVGRLHKTKDYPNLLVAFAAVQRSGLQCVLWIVGSGEERQRIEAKVAELGLGRSVFLLGARKDVPDLMSAADLFVLSSASEGFGLVVAEAMACDLAVVATDCGGVAEVMGTIGNLIPPGEPERLSEAMRTAMESNTGERGVCSLQARRRILQNFSIESATDRWESIYSGANPLVS